MILKNTIFPLNQNPNNSGNVVKRYRTSKKIKNFLISFFKFFFDDIRLFSLLRAVAISKGVAHHPQPLYAKYSSTSYFTTAVCLKSSVSCWKEPVKPQICPFLGSTIDFLPSGGIIIYPSPRKWLKSPKIDKCPQHREKIKI